MSAFAVTAFLPGIVDSRGARSYRTRAGSTARRAATSPRTGIAAGALGDCALPRVGMPAGTTRAGGASSDGEDIAGRGPRRDLGLPVPAPQASRLRSRPGP